MNKFIRNKAFTLVELIVVITILAVLATVAFISFQGYGSSSRDAARLSDIRSIEKVLELYHVQNNRYPDPSNFVNISYSGSTAWKQGTYGSTGNTNRAVLSDVPLDPLTQLPYAFSITNSRQEYQIGAVLEGSLASNNVISTSYAGDQIAEVFVRGNYNGKLIKVDANSRTYLLGVPSILASDITSVDIMDIINNNRLVYKGFNNLPASFSGSQYNPNGGFAFTPNQVILFEGDISDLENDPSQRVTFLENLQTNYSGTNISTQDDIAEMLAIDVTSSSASNYAAIVLNDSVGTEIRSIEGVSVLDEYILGDYDGDGDVDIDDYRELLRVIQRREDINMSFDLNNDGIISTFDARFLLSLCTRNRCVTAYTDESCFVMGDLSPSVIAFYNFIGPACPNDVVIPPTLYGETVTAIGENAFTYNRVIPNEQGGTTLVNPFSGTSGPLTSVIIPDTVITIGPNAFSSHSGLSSVILGNSVETIGFAAFTHNSLASLDIPSSVTSVGEFAFGATTLTDSDINISCPAPTFSSTSFRGGFSGAGFDAPSGCN